MTDGKKAMAAKAEKIKAYKKLLKMAKKEELAEDEDVEANGIGCLSTILTLEWSEKGEFEDRRTRESYFNELLCDLAERNELAGMDIKDGKKIEQESQVIQLALTAGANPNCDCPYDIDPSKPIFDAFIENDKFHGALLVAKTPGFKGPGYQDAFELLDYYLCDDHKHEYPGKAEMPYARELVYVLFSKGMKPYNPEIRKSLQPIYEEEKKAREKAPRVAGNVLRRGRVSASR